MTSSLSDKDAERIRYDEKARLLLKELSRSSENSQTGSDSIALPLRAPYLDYEVKVARYIKPAAKVLEIAAGTGVHTRGLLKTGAMVCATDISESCLSTLSHRCSDLENLITKAADIENLPFDDCSFDVVACAGSLSYGKASLVFSEISRVLKPSGLFICVDSLNHHPIYRLNRWIQFIRGLRSRSTLQNMPTLQSLDMLRQNFNLLEMKFFGAIVFLAPALFRILGANHAARVINWVDFLVGVRKSAFKFTLVAQKKSD
jgi:SAM-dependent methyltransferase